MRINGASWRAGAKAEPGLFIGLHQCLPGGVGTEIPQKRKLVREVQSHVKTDADPVTTRTSSKGKVGNSIAFFFFLFQ